MAVVARARRAGSCTEAGLGRGVSRRVDAGRSGSEGKSETVSVADVRGLPGAAEPSRPRRHVATFAAPAFWRNQSAPDLACVESGCGETRLAPGAVARYAISRGGRLARVRASSGFRSENLKRFLSRTFADYPEQRNRPDLAGTSRLSPHLHFGEISPRQIWHALKAAAEKRGWPRARWRDTQFLAEVGWREFAHHLVFHFPHTTERPLRREFEKFPWREDAKLQRAWQKGQTGFPIVDAGMRELWATGWMHNRVRMIVASFLVKDLMIDWRAGARWFWDTLVDADLAQNTLGWQWTAGCGADAAPYFRIFNPTAQGAKFDPNGGYVRHWCPELAKLPAEWIHQPDQAPAEILRAAGVELGRTYPQPVVSHARARAAALEAFARIKQARA